MQIVKRFRGRLSALLGYRNGSLFVPDENDLMLVGYPKSGNTWLNFLIASLISHSVKDIDFFSIEEKVADIYFNDGLYLKHLPKPRLFKSHEPYNRSYKNVIYIVRDPRAVAISYYYHHLKLKSFDESYPIDRFVNDFVLGRLDNFGTWGHHVEGWLTELDEKNVFLIKYENLKKNPMNILSDLKGIINMPFDERKIQHAIDWCSADNMRSLEKQCFSQHVSFKGTRSDISFVSAGQSKALLSSNSKALIESEWGNIMKKLKYI